MSVGNAAEALEEVVNSNAPEPKGKSCCHHGHEHGHEHGHSHAKVNLAVALFGGILVLNASLAKWLFYTNEPFVATLSAVAGALILALPILYVAIKDIVRGKVYMNELVALALIAAFVSGQYQEAGIIAFFMLIAITLEEKTAIGARASIEALVKLTPSSARLIGPAGEEQTVPALNLKLGDVIRIRPGENFPADGRIVNGSSTVNQASVTGESLPVDKEVGGEVYAGTENLTSMVDVKVIGVGKDTTLGKVRDLIQAAERTRLPIMRLVDRYIIYYTPTVLMIAALVWFVHGNLMQVVYVLVIACPCALVIATPSALVAAIAAAARLGILIKNVAHLETAANITTVVFDKTGTLTEGNLEVARLNPVEGVELSDLLMVAVTAESQSNHPAARAMLRLAAEANVKWQHPKSFTEYTGKGVLAKCEGTSYRVGRRRWLEECHVEVPASLEVEDMAGMSIIYVARDKQVLGWIGLRDAVRSAAEPAVTQLRELGIQDCAMVTGDNEEVAQSVARKLGITQVKSGCYPVDKVDYVKELKTRGAAVAVVGDGVNDAPALAEGDIGIAMGAIGSDVAINSASIALMNNDLRRVPSLIALARKTRLIINMNLLFGVFIIVGGIMFFIFGDRTLNRVAGVVGMANSVDVFKSLCAAFIHVFGTLIVVFNSARLVRFGEELETME